MLANPRKVFAFGASLGLLATSAMTVTVSPAHANELFKCGSDLVTYRVRSLTNGASGGIRCVKFTEGSPDGSTPRFAWYGEGRWGTVKYRHVGHAFRHPVNSAQRIGYASDIYGNGENTNANFNGNLVIQVVNGGKRILVTGAWNEEWIRESEGIVYTPLPTAKTCGGNFDQYKVADLMGKRQGSGLRCVLRLGPTTQTWFGNGNWGSTNYAHIGTLSGFNGVGASDLCNKAFGAACGTFTYGSLKLNPVAGGYTVTGAWSEKWFKSSSL